MTLSFKPLESTSTAFFHEMFHASFYTPPGEAPLTFEATRSPELRRYYEYWGREGDLGFVAMRGEEPVAIVWSRRFDQEEPGYGFVSADVPEFGVAVKKGMRGEGIGQQLMDHFLNALRERGDKQVSLSVHGDNHAAQWYQRMGFRTVAFDGKTMTMVMDL
ncbi:GNAT family N-acetyltransferase [Neolewinella agarilytica]|uniref:Acetyltransferase (GNAT) domain-containing protein n=1 Tax=Neolewinella agarilytica TaxID=478744 RepID=A0A1H9BMB9_9BACT|nr:GNAT family N-acetyltransferase [Neolewinella agarilytica]SEP89917.1 Acetyltransferase (GNAT) domain-containing protein [Neolewinella agarilytica]